jgi:hypothetical protein
LAVERVEREGWTLAAAAEAAGVSVRTVSKWLRRFRAEGEQGLLDRCSAPSAVPLRTCEARVAVIASLRRLRMTGAEIAETLGMPLSTVSGILTRIGLGKLWRLEPLEPPNRYEKRRPGELVHIDVKKLGRIGRPGHRVTGDRGTRSRGIGWEYVHVAIDDATRLVYVEVLDDEKAVTAVGFLRRAVAHFAAFGIRVERLMTDNGPAYLSILHALACKALGITSPHPALPAAHQRESGTLHPHHARRLGLRGDLPQQRRPTPRPRRLARLLQSTTTTPQPRPPSPARAPTCAQPEQRPRVLHLARQHRQGAGYWPQ